jgi:hypothetical protein
VAGAEAGDRARHQEGDQVAAGRTEQDRGPVVGAGEDGQPGRPEHQVQGLGGDAAGGAERGRGQQDGEGLPGDRDRGPGNRERHLGRQRRQRRARHDGHAGPGERRGEQLSQNQTAERQMNSCYQEKHHLWY